MLQLIVATATYYYLRTLLRKGFANPQPELEGFGSRASGYLNPIP